MIKKQDGFTLIEMLIVLMIITVLILLIVPSMAKRSEEVNDKGCDALQKTVQAQVHVYQLEENETPKTLDQMTDKYITKDQLECKNGAKLTISGGIVGVE